MRVIGSGMAGRVTRAALEACPGYEPLAAHSYSPDPAALAAIRRSAGGIQILVFVGIWCPDCKRELPRFLRVADEAGLAASQITLCVVDRLKRDPEGLAAQWGIQAVPTFICVEGERELGRIIEQPAGTLEGDIAQILLSR